MVNGLRLMEKWMLEENLSTGAIEIAKRADVTRLSFNEPFWNAETGHLYDVVDGESGENDPACRPNQLFALSLSHPILDQVHWRSVFQNIKDRLMMTPVGLQTLSPDSLNFKSITIGIFAPVMQLITKAQFGPS